MQPPRGNAPLGATSSSDNTDSTDSEYELEIKRVTWATRGCVLLMPAILGAVLVPAGSSQKNEFDQLPKGRFLKESGARWFQTLCFVFYAGFIVFPVFYGNAISGRIGILRRRSLIQVFWNDGGAPLGIVAAFLSVASSFLFVQVQLTVVCELAWAIGLSRTLLVSLYACFWTFCLFNETFTPSTFGIFIGAVVGSYIGALLTHKIKETDPHGTLALSTCYFAQAFKWHRQDEALLLLCSALQPWLLFYQSSLMKRRNMVSIDSVDKARKEAFEGVIMFRGCLVVIFVLHVISNFADIHKYFRFLLMCALLVTTLVSVFAAAQNIGWAMEESCDICFGQPYIPGLAHLREHPVWLRPLRRYTMCFCLLVNGLVALGGTQGGGALDLSSGEVIALSNACNGLLLPVSFLMLGLYKIRATQMDNRTGLGPGLGGVSNKSMALVFGTASVISIYIAASFITYLVADIRSGIEMTKYPFKLDESKTRDALVFAGGIVAAMATVQVYQAFFGETDKETDGAWREGEADGTRAEPLTIHGED